MAQRPADRPPFSSHPPPAPGYPMPFAQAPPGPHQPPVQIPFSDPFQTSRDPFLHGRRGSFGPARAWAPTSGNVLPPHHQPSPQQQAHQLPPPPPPPPHQNGVAHMPLPFDATRRGSLGSASSSPQYGRGPLDPPPPPPFAARNMPPPSSPQMLHPSSASTHLSSAPRGPPTASPFAGIRDLASLPAHRPGAGMSISSILGGSERDERKPQMSPHAAGFPPSSLPPSMRPPSPGRARSASMREGFGRREPSPLRDGIFGEPRAQSAFHDRGVSEARKEGMFASPQFQRESPHSFRAFRPEQEQRASVHGPGRPSSQPVDLSGPRTVDEIVGARRDMIPGEGRFGTFRQFGEPGGLLPRDLTSRHDAHPFPTNGITSQPRERDIFGSPQTDRDGRVGPPRYAPGPFGHPMREEATGLFRPSYQQMPDHARESIEARHDYRREEPRSSPPISDLGYVRGRNGVIDRPLTLEEHQRMDAIHREQQHRKGSDGSGPRSLFSGVSPELNRKGRTTPLPQAVQGAQPKHVGPGGDNPGIKMEFGRMFSGLGSGVKSATPTAGQMANGTSTPTRLSPSRHLENGDLVRTAVGSIEEPKTSRARGGKKNGRRSRDDEGDGRGTPDSQRGTKRTKTNAAPHHHHHHLHGHHHHHHVHENGETPGGFGMMRFPSNSGSVPAHHHHHHHAMSAHPTHHHHHHHHAPARTAPPTYKPAVTVQTKSVVDSVADQPRTHLGSQVYSTELSQPANADVSLDAKVKYRSRMKVLPYLQDRQNCTFTIRVPRYYLQYTESMNENDEASPLAAICRQAQVWGTEIYTDDSDIVAAAVHSGWLKGDFGEFNDDLQLLCEDEPPIENGDQAAGGEPKLVFDTRPNKPVKVPAGHDLHITVLILPPLEQYVSATQNFVRSREWTEKHDGMSYMIHRVEFVDEGPATRFSERGLVAKKQRIAVEEARRREAAAGLLMFANGGVGVGAVSVGA